MPVNWGAVGATIGPNVGGWIGAVVVRKNIKPWYESLKRPPWCPPNWVFGPVWTGLYSTIGYASYMVYRDGGGFSGDAKWPLVLYGSNLALNWAWTPIFFGTHNLKLACFEIELVTLTAIGTSLMFYRINPHAGLMFVPYLLWLGLASALTWKIHNDNSSNSTDSKIEELKEE